MLKKTAIATAMALTLGVSAAHATDLVQPGVHSVGTFQMDVNDGFDQGFVEGAGGPVNTDTALTGWVNEGAGTWGVASTNTFFGSLWTASNGKLITGVGDYVMDTATGVVSATTITDSIGTGGSGDPLQGSIYFSVGAGQVAGSIDFAWSTSAGIRVINVWNINADQSLSYVAVPGMENGPFPAYNAGFELTSPGLVSPVPVPAAVWLFGSGLLGLVGVARRRKAA